MRKKFVLFSCAFIYILAVIIILKPHVSFAQVPSPSCLGNCVNSSFNQSVSTAGNKIVTPTLSGYPTSIIKEAVSQPTVVHAAPCDNTLHHTKNKSDMKSNNKQENLGFLQSIIKIIEMILQFLQQLLGISLPTTTISTVTPGVTINPTITLPPCPTNTPTVSVSPSPILSVSPSITPSPTLFSNPTPSSTPTPTITPTQLTPTPTFVTVSPPPVEAVNYSGYYFHFTSPAPGDAITTTFEAVGVTCGTGFIAPWPGMGDTWDVEHNLAQLGIDIECVNGNPRYYAWTEALPAGSIYPPNTPISQGDTIVASITYQGDGKFMTTIANFERGWSIDTPMIYANTYVPVGAEVINEEVGGMGVMPFSPITFKTYLDIGGKTVQMSEQPGLTRLETTHMKTSDLTGSEFISTYR